jgi:hypothetical protein
MRRLIGPALLLASILLAYQSYVNAQPSAEIEAMARGAACQPAAICGAKGGQVQEIQTSSFGHRYRFGVQGGAKWVACKRAWIVGGAWSCEVS